MNKHTPGPWEWDDEVPADYMKADWEKKAPWLVDKNGAGVLEGQIACCNPADTRLIAAAPELLEALKMFVADWCDETGMSSPSHESVGFARAAIAKAEEQSCQS
jgi:hypothetical protein